MCDGAAPQRPALEVPDGAPNRDASLGQEAPSPNSQEQDAAPEKTDPVCKPATVDSLPTSPEVKFPKIPRTPRRVPNIEVSRERVGFLDALATELATLKQDLMGYCTVEDLKTRRPQFKIWALLSDPEIQELIDGEAFKPKAFAEALTIRKFGITSRETLKRDRSKLRKAQRNQPSPPRS